MASYRGHLMLSVPLGVGYAVYGVWNGIDPLTAGIAAVVTGVGGLLPDLDSDSGVPVRLLFTALAVGIPGILLVRHLSVGLPGLNILLALVAVGLFIRYGVSALFKKITVHRGMFHSIPAVFISGLVAFLLYHDRLPINRIVIAGGTMIGFFSHLVLDHLCNYSGGTRFKPKLHAGPVLKLASTSRLATCTAYALLAILMYAAATQLRAGKQPYLPDSQAFHLPTARR
jgi:membrane-bound metal-dependent hydrolase YbcI (DUF457 family)